MPRKKETRNRLVWEPMAGDALENVYVRLSDLMRQDPGSYYVFDFNGTRLDMSRYKSYAEMEHDFKAQLEESGRKHRETEEYKREQVEYAAYLKRSQDQVKELEDLLLSANPSGKENLGFLVAWIGAYAKVADNVKLARRFPEVLAVLRRNGRADAYTGDKFRRTRTAMAGYIVGQAISSMETGEGYAAASDALAVCRGLQEAVRGIPQTWRTECLRQRPITSRGLTPGETIAAAKPPSGARPICPAASSKRWAKTGRLRTVFGASPNGTTCRA